MRWKPKLKDPIEKWFAWYPVIIEGEIIWFEHVYRFFIQGGYGDGIYIYDTTYQGISEQWKLWRGK